VVRVVVHRVVAPAVAVVHAAQSVVASVAGGAIRLREKNDVNFL
jgi:hypothetical protein